MFIPKRVALPFVLLAVWLIPGCRSTPPKQAVTVTDNTWAVVNDREITRDEVEKAYRRVSDPSQPHSDKESLTAKLSLLNEVVVQELLLARAAELKVELPVGELDSAFAARRKNMSEEAFQQELGRRSLTASDMRDGLRRELLAQKVVEREVTSKVAVSDQEVNDFFNANRAKIGRASCRERV